MELFELYISDIKGYDLCGRNGLVNCSPYVRIFVGEVYAGRTETLTRTRDPKWNECFKFKIHQISNLSVLVKVFDSSVLVDDTLIGFVELTIRFEGPGMTHSECADIQDGSGRLAFHIKCRQLSMASLVQYDDDKHCIVDRLMRESLFQSLLPRSTKSVFMHEYTNCPNSLKHSNFFAIDAIRDYESLFSVSGTSCVASSECFVTSRNNCQSDRHIAPDIIDGCVEGSIVSIVTPKRFFTSEDAPLDSCTDVAAIRLHAKCGERFEKNIGPGVTLGALHLPWHDHLCTDHLETDGITLELLSKLQEEVKGSSGNLLARKFFTYAQLLNSGRRSTGVNGELIVDNRLRVPPVARREFMISVTPATGNLPGWERDAERWTIAEALLCQSEEEAKQYADTSGVLVPPAGTQSPTEIVQAGTDSEVKPLESVSLDSEICSMKIDAVNDTIDIPGKEVMVGFDDEDKFLVRGGWSDEEDSMDSGAVQEAFSQWDDTICDVLKDSDELVSVPNDMEETRPVVGRKEKVITLLEREGSACSTQYVLVDLERDAGSLLVGWTQRRTLTDMESVDVHQASHDILLSSTTDQSEVHLHDKANPVRPMTSKARHMRVMVPIPASMLSDSGHSPASLSFLLPRHSGDSPDFNVRVTIQCRVHAVDAGVEDGTYGVHLRWTVSSPQSILIPQASPGSFRESSLVRGARRESSIKVNAFCLIYPCEVITGTSLDDTGPMAEEYQYLVDLSSDKIKVFENSPEALLDHVKPGNKVFEGRNGQSAPGIIPTCLSGVLHSGDHGITRTTIQENIAPTPVYRDEQVDLLPFLHVDETPRGASLSLDVYENQFLLIPPKGGQQHAVALRGGQKWVPLGALSLSSMESECCTRRTSKNYSFSSLNGEYGFPGTTSEDGILTSSLDSLFNNTLELKEFEVSDEWSLVRTYGSHLRGDKNSIGCDDDDYDDTAEHDGDAWWYAMTLDNLLSNVACYQSYYPGCVYRRRCWRKSLQHKVDTVLKFESIHSLMRPPDTILHSQRGHNEGEKKLPNQSSIKESMLVNKFEWEDVVDCCVLSASSLAFTIKLSDANCQASQCSYVVQNCPAHMIMDIFHIRRGVQKARRLVEESVVPAIRSGRSRLHNSRVQSSGFISVVTDTQRDIVDQRAVRDAMIQLRDMIEAMVVEMIPSLHGRCSGFEGISSDVTPDSSPPTTMICDLSLYDADLYAKDDVDVALAASQRPLVLHVVLPNQAKSNFDIKYIVLERLMGYYRLIAESTHYCTLRPNHTASSATSIQVKLKSQYMPHNATSKEIDESVTPRSQHRRSSGRGGHFWKEVSLSPFSRPDFSVSGIVDYVHRLLLAAEDSILRTSNSDFSLSRSDTYLEQQRRALCDIANDCLSKIVSATRSLLAWKSPEDKTNKLGPWADAYLPLSLFFLKNNTRLLIAILAVSASANFGVSNVPCFSRFTNIRHLIHWELHSRVISMYTWVRSLHKGGLKYLLESRCAYYGSRVMSQFLQKETCTVENTEEHADEGSQYFTPIPEGFRHALRECLLDGYMEVCALYYTTDYSDVTHVILPQLDRSQHDNYVTLLMENKCFSLTAISRLHDIVGNTLVNCLSILLNEYMMILRECAGKSNEAPHESANPPTVPVEPSCFAPHPLMDVPKYATRGAQLRTLPWNRKSFSSDGRYKHGLGGMLDSVFCVMSAIASDCEQIERYIEEIAVVMRPFFYTQLLASLERNESAALRKIVNNIDNVHSQLHRLQENFQRLWKRALREQCRVIFKYVESFELNVNDGETRKASRLNLGLKWKRISKKTKSKKNQSGSSIQEKVTEEGADIQSTECKISGAEDATGISPHSEYICSDANNSELESNEMCPEFIAQNDSSASKETDDEHESNEECPGVLAQNNSSAAKDMDDDHESNEECPGVLAQDNSSAAKDMDDDHESNEEYSGVLAQNNSLASKDTDDEEENNYSIGGCDDEQSTSSSEYDKGPISFFVNNVQDIFESPDEFGRNLNFLSRLIYNLSSPEVYDMFCSYGLISIATPLLNALTTVHNYVDGINAGLCEMPINSSELSSELRGELMNVYKLAYYLILPSWKVPKDIASSSPPLEAGAFTTLFAVEETDDDCADSSVRHVRSKIKSLDKSLFATLCAIETAFKKRTRGKDMEFLDILSSIDEFQSPLITKLYSREAQLDLMYLASDSETLRSPHKPDIVSIEKAGFKYSEMVEISGLCVRGISSFPTLSEENAQSSTNKDDTQPLTGDAAVASDTEARRTNIPINSCYIEIVAYSRSGTKRNSFQTKCAAAGDRNPTWFDVFRSDPQRCSDTLPGGTDPLERLDIMLYNRRVISPASMLFAAVTESSLIARTTIQLEMLRLNSIRQWFEMTLSEDYYHTGWSVIIHVHTRIVKERNS